MTKRSARWRVGYGRLRSKSGVEAAWDSEEMLVPVLCASGKVERSERWADKNEIPGGPDARDRPVPAKS
jgi:hypothetical protein